MAQAVMETVEVALPAAAAKGEGAKVEAAMVEVAEMVGAAREGR